MSEGGTGRILDCKVYIEGVDIPFNSASINLAPNQPSSATISIIPVHAAHRLRPRSHVHIFYFDDLEETPNRLDKWKLLWEGEVVGMGYNYTTGSRHFRIDCMDLTNYWDTTTVYTLGPFSAIGSLGKYLTGEMKTEDKMVFYSGNTSTKPLGKQGFISSENEQALGAMAGYIKKYPLPETLTKVVEKFQETVGYVNTHHTRKKVVDKIVALEDEGVKSIANKTLVESFNEVVQETQRSSFREMLTRFQSYGFYNFVNINSPVFEEATNKIKSFLFKPNFYFGAPPRCNVIFPDQVIALDFSRQFLFEKTRAILTAEPPGTQFAQHVYFGPGDFEEILSSADGKIKGGETFASNVFSTKDNPTFRLSEEEIEKGVIPEDRHIGRTRWTRYGGSHAAMVLAADYIGQVQRYEARSMTVQSEFNPNVVVDFPGLVFTKRGSFLCHYQSITHTIDSRSGASTVINANMTRVVEHEEEYLDEPFPTLTTNSKYMINFNSKRGKLLEVNDTYEDLLGCSSIVTEKIIREKTTKEELSRIEKDLKSRPGGERTSEERISAAQSLEGRFIHAAALDVFKGDQVDGTTDYDKASNKYLYAKEFNRRNRVATLLQVFTKHYGLKASFKSSVSTEPPVEFGFLDDDETSPFNYVPEKGTKYTRFNTKEDALKDNRIITSKGHKKDIARMIREDIVDSGRGIDGR